MVIMIGFNHNLLAQNPTVEKAKKLYNYFDYPGTIEKLEPLTDKTPEIIKMLAYSYLKTTQYAKAENYFAQLVRTDIVTPDDLINYAKVLMINQKYDSAVAVIERYKKLRPNDYRASLFLKNKNFYDQLLGTEGFYMLKTLNMNTEADDFGPVFYRDSNIIFSSTRTYLKMLERKWNWNRQPFLDFYIGTYDTITYQIRNIRPFNFKFNRKYHEGTATVSKDGNYIIFTSDIYGKPGKDKTYHLGLFESYFKNGHWSKPKPLPFNSKDYSVGHPTLTPDGHVLYFVSDMPGGIGGTDIYMAYRLGDTAWSKPKNLGKGINTEGNEMFPFYQAKGYLFFASDGHPGLGGLDIFVATRVNDTVFEDITNLGYPINSSYDDFSLIADDSLKYCYFASNRKGGKGEDDLYAAKINFPFFIKRIIAGHTYDQDSVILPETKVVLFDQNRKPIDSTVTKADGYFEFIVQPMRTYYLSGTKEKFQPDSSTVKTDKPVEKIYTDLYLRRNPFFKLLFIVRDDSSHKPLPGVIGDLYDKYESELFSIYTKAHYDTLKLNGVEIGQIRKFNIILEKRGYLKLEDTFSIAFDHEGYYYEDKYMKRPQMHKLKLGEDISKYIGVKNIYFDLDKYNIRPDAAKELDKVVKVLQDNPTLKLELRAHTDYRGSDRYNLILSDNRAKSAAAYIRKRINDPTRIRGKGFGETKPLKVTKDIHQQYPFLPIGQVLTEKYIKSLPSKDQQEIANQLNRRVEFIVIGF